MRRFLAFFVPILIAYPCHSQGGYIGAGYSINNSISFDQQNNGFRIDWGTRATSGIDLEWSYVDFGTSVYDDPTFIPADESDPDESEHVAARYENIGFGTVESSDTYKGIANLHAQGLSAGLKFKLNANDWLQFYARASLLAWQATTRDLEISQAQDPIFDADDPTKIINENNACGETNTNFCRYESAGKTHLAVDFWYGYGLIAKPFDWMALRAEYSITALKAVDFPRSKIEGFSTSMEIHF